MKEKLEKFLDELKDYSDNIVCDGLGSIIFSKIKNEKCTKCNDLCSYG